MRPHELLDHLIRAAVVAEPTEDGRLRLRALFDDRPLTDETRDLCSRNKQVLLAYARFTQEADRLLLDSTRRIAAAWPRACSALDLDAAWDDLEAELHHAYWRMDCGRLREVIDRRERYVLDVATRHQRGWAADSGETTRLDQKGLG
jgi:hypothetical protein